MLLVVFPAASCGNYPFDKFEALCRAKADIAVEDPAAWQAYISALRRPVRKYADTGLSSSYEREKELNRLVIRGAEGFEFETEYLSNRELGEGRSPKRNNITIKREERPIARITDYWVYQGGIGGGTHWRCTDSFPELYGVIAEPEREAAQTT